MSMIATIKNLLGKARSRTAEKSVVDAYNIWSGSYDNQPGNLMLELDKLIFSELLNGIDIANKKVVDIGCGTGRHWLSLYSRTPSVVVGFDVSEGMLEQLNRKFPDALTLRPIDSFLPMLPDGFADCLVTTLTIAHIKNIDEAIGEWSRILVNDGDLIITDFHPEILAKGGKRSFTHDGKSLSVTNYIHSLDEVKYVFNKYGLFVVEERTRHVDEQVRGWYAAQNALAVYNRYKGVPVIYGLHLKKQYAAQ
jgi:ubiquinone/menaquinone biosynthesis C-methylase UbiE